MRVIFVGTSEFALPTLKKLGNGDWELVSIVCQPDRLKGRGRVLVAPPTKKLALEMGVPVFQPEKIKSEESIAHLKSLKPDIMITASYGQILSAKVLDLPRLGCFNVHASLLPSYRGASPMNWAIINGDSKAGVTLFKMDPGMDTGEMALWAEIEIEERERLKNLHDKLALLGAFSQDEKKVTLAPILKKEDGCINWNDSSVNIDRRIRGLYFWPGTYTFMDGKTIKIVEAIPVEKPEYVFSDNPGELYLLSKARGVGVICEKGCLELEKVKPENRKEQTSKEFLSGLRGNLDGKVFSACKSEE